MIELNDKQIQLAFMSKIKYVTLVELSSVFDKLSLQIKDFKRLQKEEIFTFSFEIHEGRIFLFKIDILSDSSVCFSNKFILNDDKKSTYTYVKKNVKTFGDLMHTIHNEIIDVCTWPNMPYYKSEKANLIVEQILKLNK